MNWKILTAASLLAVILLVGGVVWYGESTQIKKQDVSERSQRLNDSQQQKFVTDVDPDVNHWQTKETEYFTIKFPKEWYWMESSHGENEGYSNVITNNPNFDIVKYADIGIGAGFGYPVTLVSDKEVIIAFGGVSVTAEVGTSRESIAWQVKRTMEHENSDADCTYVDNKNLSEAYCAFIDEKNQKVQVFYVVIGEITYGFTLWTMSNNDIVNKDILGKIAQSFTVKGVTPHN